MFPGLHSWLFFAQREQDNKANYLGYIDKVDLSGVSSTYIVCTYLYYCNCDLSRTSDDLTAIIGLYE